MSAQKLTDILTASDIEKLKTGYVGKMVANAAIASFSGPFEPAGDFARAITNQFYAEAPTEDQMSARDRELACLALFADVPDKNFQTHVYLALMEGLSPALIVNTVYLAALYRGAAVWEGASDAIGVTFECLKAAAAGDAADASIRGVLGKLRG
jgi:alkylhydroperoxidase/carboxymuconolactone decarboxylase family protein YurZ